MKVETLSVQCPCGQETNLVKLEDGWHYDEKKHGNSEPCNNGCFNCHASLGLEPEPVEEPVKDVVDPAAAQASAEMSEPVEPVSDAAEAELAAMNRPQLRERARELEISVPRVITNEGIRSLIRAKSNGEKSE